MMQKMDFNFAMVSIWAPSAPMEYSAASGVG